MTGESAPVRVGLIGVGYWGPNLVRNLHELPEAEPVVVCDLRDEALARISSRFPSVTTTTSVDELLSRDDIEAVVVATPVSTHFELAAAALRAGKHVLVEKPLAASAAQALELAALSGRCGRLVMPGHTFLYSPPVNLIRDVIASGELGDIYFVSTSRVNLGLHQPDVSVVWDLAPHDFSILRYWLEAAPSHVSALSRSCVFPGTPDVAFIDLEFGSRTIAHVELSWLAPSKLRRTTIVGSEKMIVYDDVSTEPVRIFDSGVSLRDPETFGEYRLTYRTGDIVSKNVPVAEPLFLELRDFCNSIRTATTPRSSTELGVEVVQMIEAVDRSLANEGARTAIGAGDATHVEA
jgi:predicted dehydrogenase